MMFLWLSPLFLIDWKYFVVFICVIQGRSNYQKILSVDSQAGQSRHWGRSLCGLVLLRSLVLTKENIRGEGILNHKKQKKET